MKKLAYVIVLVSCLVQFLFGRLYSRQHPGPQNNANGIEENGEGLCGRDSQENVSTEKAGQMVLSAWGTEVNNDIKK